MPAKPLTPEQYRAKQAKRYPLRHHRRRLVRELAVGVKPRAQLAREYGVTAGAITAFAQRNLREIDALKAAIGQQDLDRLAGLWIANQEQRVAMFQVIAEESVDEKVVVSCLKAVAEELGQVVPRTTVTVMPVVHVIEGVDGLDMLK